MTRPEKSRQQTQVSIKLHMMVAHLDLCRCVNCVAALVVTKSKNSGAASNLTHINRVDCQTGPTFGQHKLK